MDDETSKLPPPLPFGLEHDERAEDEQPRLPPKRSARSIRDFFGKPTPALDGEFEQDSGFSTTSAKEVNHGVTTTNDLAGKPEADTSVDSISIVESASKRKTAAGAQSGRKKTGGRKITDEDAEMREMEAAVRKKQKLESKAAKGKGKAAAVDLSDADGVEGALADQIPKKRGRPRKLPQSALQEIIDISSPTKEKFSRTNQPTKRRGRPLKDPTKKMTEELDLTHTESEDEVRVLGPSRNGSTASSAFGRNRVKGTRSADSMWDGAVQVVEDEAPPVKKKANPSTAGKPMHSFFARPKPASFDADMLARTDAEVGGGNVQAADPSAPADNLDAPRSPIASITMKYADDIFTSTCKRAPEANPSVPNKTLNPFFTPLPAPLPTSTVGRPGWARHATIVKDALWPSAEEIEVPSDDAIERPRLDLPRRARQRMAGTENEGFWARMLPKAVVKEDVHGSGQVEKGPAEVNAYTGHPAITSLEGKAANGGKTQLWIDKYRPLNHAEVLGNEVPAKYLVDWLGELAIGIGGELSEERRPVQRKVIKTRKRQPREDDWIVEDNEPIRGFDDAAGDEAVNNIEAAQPAGYPNLSKRLTNSILLQGPYGSGKTASIYAAASELGWEVFEVYPGIGKRSGVSLSQLVGDVGTNHMVGKGRPTMPPSPAPHKKPNPLLQAFAKVSGEAHGDVVATSVPVDLTNSPTKKTQDKDFGFVAPAESRECKTSGSDVRQSLILVEEVDILFEEDKGFWGAVVALIEESKRPVIMTCNDLSVIPFEDLALQTTLLYSPPHPAAAKALLGGIAAAEGQATSSQYLRSLVKSCQLRRPNPVVFNRPLVPPTDTHWPLGVDLRAAVCQLQLEGGGSPHLAHSLREETKRRERVMPSLTREGDPNGESLSEMREVAKMTDVISSVDAGIARRPQAITELCDPDHYKPSEDDQVGFHALLKPLPRLENQILAMLSREDEMASAVIALAENVAGRDGWVDDSLLEILGETRQTYQATTLEFLDPLIPLDSHLLPHPAIFLDYIPHISWMTRIDDTLAAQDATDVQAGRSRVNRKTGRMQRVTAGGYQGYVRQMAGGLGETQLEAVRRCRLEA
ncbi:hypothetical protein NliqN6_5497 [Naganishia liquefaciens]|uniref:AAA+ ATPase domain-containing protein n=1 Tax=Naganishia liquefaciens TaxID=104408 RepID=A0A8H3YGP7_9TREE|nr:hypothetical protein NliqN6_5497 [Naganishia liquefaciens]